MRQLKKFGVRFFGAATLQVGGDLIDALDRLGDQGARQFRKLDEGLRGVHGAVLRQVLKKKRAGELIDKIIERLKLDLYINRKHFGVAVNVEELAQHRCFSELLVADNGDVLPVSRL